MPTNKIVTRLEQAMSQLVTLNVVTVVGQTTLTLDEKDGKRVAPSLVVDDKSQSKVLWTSVDLFQGDIVTVVHPDLRGPDGADVRALHEQCQTKAAKIVQENVAALGSLLKLLTDAYKAIDTRKTATD